MQPARLVARLYNSSPSSICSYCRRRLSTSAPIWSGHSKWATIKHDKARNDSARGRQRQALAAEITLASREHGPDPVFNPRLADAIAKASKMGYPKAGIESAILRGQGKSSTGAALEAVTIEVVLPPVAVIIEALTDSRGRTLQEVKTALKHVGGQLSPTAYLFQKRGRITFVKNASVGADDILEDALEAGAVDVFEDDEGRVVVDTEPHALKQVEKWLVDARQLEVSSSDAIWTPNEDTQVQEIEEQTAIQLAQLEEELQSLNEVHSISTNLKS